MLEAFNPLSSEYDSNKMSDRSFLNSPNNPNASPFITGPGSIFPSRMTTAASFQAAGAPEPAPAPMKVENGLDYGPPAPAKKAEPSQPFNCRSPLPAQAKSAQPGATPQTASQPSNYGFPVPAKPIQQGAIAKPPTIVKKKPSFAYALTFKTCFVGHH